MLDSDTLSALQTSKPYLDFKAYMEIALYHPKVGYYMQPHSPFGRDFLTAPMFSSLLAQAISAWLFEKNTTDLMEIGAGNGLLAKQILDLSPFIKAYYIVERYPQRSQALLERYPQCQWSQSMEYTGTVIANELLDAFPFRRFLWHEGVLSEFVVDTNLKMMLIEVENNLPTSVFSQVSNHQGPYVFEYCDYRSFFEKLRCQDLLLIDYGYEQDYFHPDRMLGNMMCFKDQKTVPFSVSQTGKIDISSAVNWLLVEEIAKEYGYQVENMGTQADFILSYVNNIKKEDTVLLYGHEMGNYVKVMHLSKS